MSSRAYRPLPSIQLPVPFESCCCYYFLFLIMLKDLDARVKVVFAVVNRDLLSNPDVFYRNNLNKSSSYRKSSVEFTAVIYKTCRSEHDIGTDVELQETEILPITLHSFLLILVHASLYSLKILNLLAFLNKYSCNDSRILDLWRKAFRV